MGLTRHSILSEQDWFPYQSNVTLSRYAFELNEVFTYDRITKNFPGMQMHLFAHSPDAVCPTFPPFAPVAALTDLGLHLRPTLGTSTLSQTGTRRSAMLCFSGALLCRCSRKIVALTSGTSSLRFEGSFYPLRTTISAGIRDGKSFIKRHDHPGRSSQRSAPVICAS